VALGLLLLFGFARVLRLRRPGLRRGSEELAQAALSRRVCSCFLREAFWLLTLGLDGLGLLPLDRPDELLGD